MTKHLYVPILAVLFLSFSFVWAVIKPAPDADMDSLSYIFYLYYDNGQLFADRDYQIKYDIINEKFISQSPGPNSYRGEIVTFQSEAAETFYFDPAQGNPKFVKGKIQLKAPYVPNGSRVSFYDNQSKHLVTMFISTAALCNEDDFCSSNDGENGKTCPSDCKQARTSPVATTIPPPSVNEGIGLMSILIYVFSGLGVVVVAWFGWKWWKKKKEESFLPPMPPSLPTPPTSGGSPSSSSVPPSSFSPPPPRPLGSAPTRFGETGEARSEGAAPPFPSQPEM